ncbi:leucine-rich repeat-containing protein 19-like [Syngnathus typhle]|uniref:leucine-rich repeat-containing protein 19-like n=1 Tax=Syngnathus typhle TaxID=161592 RepID=UPI002A6A866D|nr:leucine-rich repeat-containing protein 19-like [Syngnathus typhle]XP_061122176.1 leucine-rich repeat-containing protein 19-like [Syngnathus typhle]
MGQPQQFLHLLCSVCLVAIFAKNNHAVENANVRNLTATLLDVIPCGSSNSSVTSLVVERNQITLSNEDRQALASYPQLLELHLDLNQVTNISARYLSVLPNLSVLSLSKNQISSLVPESFYGLEALRMLNLSHNLLTSLPAKLFSELNNLQVVDLQGNPWNCSCHLLSSIEEIRAAGVTIGQNTKCASPRQQAGMNVLEAECHPTAASSSNSTSGTMEPSKKPDVLLTIDPDDSNQMPASGNTWKFVACVVALALTTSMLVVCAIKGPSWYRLFHNYRHRRLQQEENQEDRPASSIYSETGRCMTHQTIAFENNRAEGEEDVHYFEDPYIKAGE